MKDDRLPRDPWGYWFAGLYFTNGCLAAWFSIEIVKNLVQATVNFFCK